MHCFVCLKILQIEDPGCFWVIIKGYRPFLDHEVDYQKLNSAMNDFYNSTRQDIEIKPLMLEEGQVCIKMCFKHDLLKYYSKYRILWQLR